MTVAIQVALLPNLISPGIAWAAAQSGPPLVSVELPSGEAPKQLTGTAGGLPHLVDSAVTRSKGLPARKTAEPPKGSLPVEQRHKTSGEPAEGGLASPPPLPSELSPSPAPDAKRTARDADKPASSEEKTEIAAALAKARRTDSRVLVESATTENSRTYANSNGTLTTQITAPVSTDTYVETTEYQNGTYQLGSGHPSSSSLWVGTSANTYEIPTSYVRDRAFLRFNLSAVPAGATVTAAEMKLWNSSSNACSSVSVKAAMVTESWWSDIAWYDQPEVDWSEIPGVNVSSSCGSSSPRAMKWDVTSMVEDWVSGWYDNYGVRLTGPEGTSSQTRTFASAESSNKPALTITYQPPNTAPTVAAPQIAPTVTAETGGVVTSLTPVLSAVLSDADGGSLSGEFQVQVGSSLVWSGTASGVAAGGKATVAVPAGKLSDGQTIQYRARAYDGSAYSEWSAWQTARVTAMPLDTVTFQQFTPADNTQVGSLTPALSAYAQAPGEAATSYWYQVCAGPKDNWTWCESSTWVKGAWTVPAGKLQWGKTYWWYAQAATSAATATSSWRSFTAVPEQDSINALLAAGTDGREFNHVTGNYTHTETDLTVATVGPPLSVVRTYNSLDPRTDGAFGAGWTTRWDTRLENEPLRSTVLITYPDGRQWRFAAKGDGTYASPAGTYATLATQSGGGWRLMDKESTSYWFDSAGRLVKVTDSRGRTQTLQYGTDGKLSKVTGASGRSLTFTWNGGHVTGVASDAVDGAPISWSYTYDGDYLVKVCPPSSGGACVGYEYGDRSQYRSSVIDGRPVGYWRLNETGTGIGSVITNDMKSISGVGDAKIAGSTADATGGTQAPLDGSSDTAMTFKGASGSAYVSLPAGVINGLGGDTTIEAWFKTTGSGTILGYQNSATDAPSVYTPAIYVGTDGKLRGQLWTGTVAPITSATSVNDGNWHHVALSGARTTQTLYLDGQQVGTLAQQITQLGQWDTRIGYGFASSSWPGTVTSSRPFPFAGSIDEVAVYGKPLRQEQIRTHYRTRQVRQQLTKITKASGRVAAVNTYAADGGRLLTHTDANGGLWKLSSPAYAKDSTGASLATITVTDPRNGTLTYVDDASRDDRLVSWTDQLGKTTRYEYDTGGFVAKVTDRNGIASQFANDVRGNLLAKTICRTSGSCGTEYLTYHVNADDLFDPRNDQVVEYRDRRSSDEDDDTYLTTIEYDQYGDKVKQTGPATGDFPSGRSAGWAYTDGTEPAAGGGTTPAGLLKSEKKPNGAETTYRYRSNGDLAETTDAAGLITRFGYDALGRKTSRTVVSAAEPDGVTTGYAYDGLGRVVKATGAGVANEVTSATHTAEVRTAYDVDGNVLTATLDDLSGSDPDRVTTYTYDTLGRVKTMTGPEGGVTQYSFDATGALVSATSPAGALLQFGYTPRGEKATVTVKNWTGSPAAPQPAADVVLTSYAYDPGGRLASETDAMGRTTRYTYWDDDLVSQKIADDARLNGFTTPRDVVLASYEYDWAGNPLKTVTGGGKTRTDYVYDAANRLTSETIDPAGLARTTSYGYDANGNVVSTTKTAAGTSRTERVKAEFDDANRKIKQIVENGDTDLVTTWKYDDRGLVTEVTSPRGNASGADRLDYTTLNRYDAVGRLVETKQPPVAVERGGGAPANQRPVIRYGYNTAGEQTDVLDPEGRASSIGYDRAGQRTSQTSPSYTPPGGSAITPVTAYGYDAAGRLTTITDPRGNVTTNTYDVLDRLVRVSQPPATGGATPGHTDYTYTLDGELLSVTDPTGARKEATYDDLGRQITSTVIERKPTTATLTSYSTYDDAGNLLTEKRPGGDTTTATVNAAGELTELTDPLGDTTTFDFDLAGRQTKVTDPLGKAGSITYDLAGRPTTVKDLDAAGATVRTRSIGYDLDGNPVSRTDAEGHAVTYDFDALGRVKRMVEPVSAGDSITTSFGYDAAGARTRYTDGRGNVTVTTYNSLGRVESVIEPSTAGHPNLADRTWTTSYDTAGNPVRQLQPGGVTITSTFDNLNRLTQQAGSGGGAAPTAPKTFGYDLAGRAVSAGDLAFTLNDRGQILKTTKGGVDQATFAYDANDRLVQRGDAAGAATFTWDGKDRLKTTVDPLTGVTVSYDYDKADRLTSATYGSGGPQRSYGYDALDRVTSDVLKTGGGADLASITYGYDKEDRLTSKVTSGTAGAGGNSYTYDFAGRLTSWTDPSSTTTTYEWDASGNRTRAGNDTFTYDERNRLVSGAGVDYTYTPRGTLASASKDGTVRAFSFDAFDRMVGDGNADYTYDALDRMTGRTKGGATTRYVYADMSNDVVAVTDAAGAAQETYSRGAFGDVLSAKIGTNAAQFQMADRHGDVVAGFTAGATSLAGSTAYTPFGQVVTGTGTRPQLGFQGEWTDTDTDTGEVNMHARWYQPGTGTFTSRDTANLDPASSVRANRYTYAGASPLNYSDPTGHQQVEVCLAGFSCGGYVCSGDTCYETDAHARWWEEYLQSPWYKATEPRISDERAKELGVMPDGHQAPKGFWSVDEKRREAYMLAYDGRLTDQQLDLMWQLVKTMPMNEKSMDGLLPSGAIGDWLNNLRKKVGEGAWKGIKTAFCAVVGGESQCNKLLSGDKATWDKYGSVLAKAADIVFRSWVSLTSVMLEYNAKFKLANVEAQLKTWAYKLTGKPCGSALGGKLSVCGGLPGWLFPEGRGGYTIGAVFLTKLPLKDALLKTDLLQHEYVHTQQWYTYAGKTGWWFSFAIAYWLAGPNPCTNTFEIQAGLVKGGYGKQCGLT
ncbi:DNRLRE domain-containing protein [Microbispora sp. NEAU-D428]|uniref:DNRLRE domain-containing protein n=1 Tax=Microbispora sitophila TaxID=2771537 RepID=UPI001866AF47|nr:DNRLRE domain-containing protein [Microbispora sitophila]MBE3013439.1 DNRLRE domain-containing protein [Microbispora sitophila]